MTLETFNNSYAIISPIIALGLVVAARYSQWARDIVFDNESNPNKPNLLVIVGVAIFWPIVIPFAIIIFAVNHGMRLLQALIVRIAGPAPSGPKDEQ